MSGMTFSWNAAVTFLFVFSAEMSAAASPLDGSTPSAFSCERSVVTTPPAACTAACMSAFDVPFAKRTTERPNGFRFFAAAALVEPPDADTVRIDAPSTTAAAVATSFLKFPPLCDPLSRTTAARWISAGR